MELGFGIGSGEEIDIQRGICQFFEDSRVGRYDKDEEEVSLFDIATRSITEEWREEFIKVGRVGLLRRVRLEESKNCRRNSPCLSGFLLWVKKEECVLESPVKIEKGEIKGDISESMYSRSGRGRETGK